MAMQNLFKNFRVCATCVHWCGNRRPDATRSLIRFDNSEKGECAGGGFDRLKMNAMATCNKYKQWLER